MPRMARELDSLDALVGAFYSAFDNRGGRVATVEAVTSLFAPQGVIAKRTAAGFEISTPEEFAQPRVALLRGTALVGFHEWETSGDSRIEGDLALRTSRYEKAGTMNGEPYAGKGTKFFNFVRMDGEWRILSLAWADDE
jgi:hypothetical protein